MPVIMFGDWGLAKRRFNGLAFKMQRGAQWSIQQEAEAMARRVKNNLYAQNYVGPGHPPDAPATVAKKEAEGNDTRTLIETSRYVDGIEAIRLGRYEWSVGVRDPTLAFIGTLMEWGFYNARADEDVPARPHWRTEMERTRTALPGQRLPAIQTAMAAVLGGDFD